MAKPAREQADRQAEIASAHLRAAHLHAQAATGDASAAAAAKASRDAARLGVDDANGAVGRRVGKLAAAAKRGG